MKEQLKGIKYRIKDEMGLNPRNHNFQQTVTVICDCRDLETKKTHKLRVFFATHPVL